MVAKVVSLALRGVQLVFTVIIMALIGNIIDTAFAGNPSSINFAMFVAAFSLLSLIYFFLVGFNESFMFHGLIPVILDALNVIFFFCSATDLAAELGVHDCSNNVYTLHNHITNGAGNRKARCQEAQASDAFLWFTFALYVATLAFSILDSQGSANLRSVRRGPAPAMSQV